MHGEGEGDFHPIACSSKRSVGCTNTFSFKNILQNQIVYEINCSKLTCVTIVNFCRHPSLTILDCGLHLWTWPVKDLGSPSHKPFRMLTSYQHENYAEMFRNSTKKAG